MVGTAQTEEVGEGARRGSGENAGAIGRIKTWPMRLAGADLVDIQAILGHVNLATTQIYTHMSEDRMAGVVARL